MTRLEALSIEMVCRLHDVGAIGMDEKALEDTQTGRLDPHWFLTSHTTTGHELLHQMPDDMAELASAVARHHHEWWNGCGLPDGLRHDEIPLAARICAVANEYVDMTSEGRNHERWTHECAVRQISTMAGVQLDPAVVEVFLAWAGSADDSTLDESRTSLGYRTRGLVEHSVAMQVN